LGTFFFAVIWTAMLEEEDVEATSLSTPAALLEIGVRHSDIANDDGGLVSLTNHYSVGAGAVQGAVNEKHKD
jgi:hypothetical protein